MFIEHGNIVCRFANLWLAVWISNKLSKFWHNLPFDSGDYLMIKVLTWMTQGKILLAHILNENKMEPMLWVSYETSCFLTHGKYKRCHIPCNLATTLILKPLFLENKTCLVPALDLIIHHHRKWQLELSNSMHHLLNTPKYCD